jgi:hypothetical protein
MAMLGPLPVVIDHCGGEGSTFYARHRYIATIQHYIMAIQHLIFHIAMKLCK